mmetsp:Transcript_28019/g.70352  ORF Transcript_28019/g.70352 Transcript_28019/m.70352 type:complete len:365 (-) Transcript_28019:439-1533(-)
MQRRAEQRLLLRDGDALAGGIAGRPTVPSAVGGVHRLQKRQQRGGAVGGVAPHLAGPEHTRLLCHQLRLLLDGHVGAHRREEAAETHQLPHAAAAQLRIPEAAVGEEPHHLVEEQRVVERRREQHRAADREAGVQHGGQRVLCALQGELVHRRRAQIHEEVCTAGGQRVHARRHQVAAPLRDQLWVVGVVEDRQIGGVENACAGVCVAGTHQDRVVEGGRDPGVRYHAERVVVQRSHVAEQVKTGDDVEQDVEHVGERRIGAEDHRVVGGHEADLRVALYRTKQRRVLVVHGGRHEQQVVAALNQAVHQRAELVHRHLVVLVKDQLQLAADVGSRRIHDLAPALVVARLVADHRSADCARGQQV